MLFLLTVLMFKTNEVLLNYWFHIAVYIRVKVFILIDIYISYGIFPNAVNFWFKKNLQRFNED